MVDYDIIVIGAGHAGIEASLAVTRLGKKTALITINKDNIGKMPCNPSIGGPAKGIVTREIDALGGQMGYTADRTALQFKMLNSAKGPGVRALRVQSDKLAYSTMMKELCLKQKNLTVVEGFVERLMVKNQEVKGVELKDGSILSSQIVIMTTGTYMAGKNIISDEVKVGGPDLEPTTNNLSESLRQAGIRTFRLKTGTPPRVLTGTIDFTKTKLETGTEGFYHFSTLTKERDVRPFQEQISCYMTHTVPETHEIILNNLNKSSMYSGVVEGVGPRYCPSIEDKLVRFKDKERHLLFLEPESLSLPTTYIQGFSSSLPRDIQFQMVHTLPGLENCKIVKYAYAIEYDALDPIQMKSSFESKVIKNLFTAGQINGTSGYEEAAGQGLLAGINAVRKLDEKEPIVFSRDQAYIGVLVDDLTTKGTKEPYRLLTSRAEYRLLLRHDNAEERLMGIGHQIGLIPNERYESFLKKQSLLDLKKEELKKALFSMNDARVKEYLSTQGYEDLSFSMNGEDLVKRPRIQTQDLFHLQNKEIDKEIAEKMDIDIKYEGYIAKARREAEKLKAMDNRPLPEDINYDDVLNLSIEGRQKLKDFKPETLGKASRISGVNPADIAVLSMYLKNK
ncbi:MULTISPECIES: tRNA uridine-5-carboxymethylaminomethyl(34) synthesis enzyme MnmG [Terrabacteria group]|uniref:tRNA uridine-5-carboxymethylaminomethyl(34) synthesis enzyme MnmG n=1 Tax=Bacillati TaxID=1783272 RepID=UPI001939D473|nr:MULTISPECIES: tRNA uridine-5-carboxymethylaminomethyl(34) synthesis enzyme MnmG [Terrabacteria group]MBW9212491.1 tRNA uridine-5-carboxymethylaminomethyl(34) synthesis enzyme MnmG [Trueperella sp. zg.1013]QRG86753.1 tRNA uridine-5-carboxymethylaminomethyl(34) synthesis enzyme MnmG [Bulleidia sp. zg-1006]